jgi:hypothetical protein
VGPARDQHGGVDVRMGTFGLIRRRGPGPDVAAGLVDDLVARGTA